MGGGGNDDNFKSVCPQYLTCVNWENPNHRTAVTSSLVQGVYTMQRDKTMEREALANPWWESFGFSLAEPLIDEDDKSIYGAVFMYDNSKNIGHSGTPPGYVIAFRGMMLKCETWHKDLNDGIRCLFNSLNKSDRCKQAIQTIRTVLEKYTTDRTVSVWLAGHSLGAGVALLAGKTMTKRGLPLKTYAFNPPHSSFPLKKLYDIGVVNDVFRFTESLFKGALARMLSVSLDPGLLAWTPYVYLNPSDIVCSEYVRDLKHKKRMAYLGLGKINSIGAGISIRSIVCGIKGGEPIQLLLSADMTVNTNKPNFETDSVLKKRWYKFQKAHALAQWWDPDPALRANWEEHRLRPS